MQIIFVANQYTIHCKCAWIWRHWFAKQSNWDPSRMGKAGDEHWSHMTISFKYGYNSTLILTKKLIFCQKSLNNAFANERIDAYLSYSTKNLSSNKKEIRHSYCGAHLIKFGITLTLPTESTILYTTTVEGLTFLNFLYSNYWVTNSGLLG